MDDAIVVKCDRTSQTSSGVRQQRKWYLFRSLCVTHPLDTHFPSRTTRTNSDLLDGSIPMSSTSFHDQKLVMQFFSELNVAIPSSETVTMRW